MTTASAFDPLAARAASANAVPPPAGTDYLSQRAAGQQITVPGEQKETLPTGSPMDAVTGFVGGIGGGLAAGVAGGYKALWDLAQGKSGPQTLADMQALEQRVSGDVESLPGMRSPYAKAGAAAAGSDFDPLNWPQFALSKAGDWLARLSEKAGAPPWVSGAAAAAPTAATALLGLRFGGEPYEVEAEEGPTAEAASEPAAESVSGVTPKPPPEESEPVPGGVPKEAQGARSAILRKVLGDQDQRLSAIEGNAKDAATDYQASKVDEPAGRGYAAQFEAERNGMTRYAQNLVTRVGGTLGTDEESLSLRGATIARPFDSLRQWFDDRMGQLYVEAGRKARAGVGTAYVPGAGTTLTNLEGVDRLLGSPSFRNSLMAKDQQGLLAGVTGQLQAFRETHPNGFMADDAEQFRQWLNSIWTPKSAWAIGQLKDAVDEDVLKNAGEDVYAQARAMRVLKRQVLEDPKGIAHLFDFDPQTPINRVTPFGRIPTSIMSMYPEQFQNLLTTLREKMPEELRPQADAALGEIKGELLNRLVKAGSQTRSGRGAQVWHGEDVSTAIGRESAKIALAFADDPEMLQNIKDLNSAGQILSVNEGYPGAYAQAANLAKRNMGGAIIKQAARGLGAAVGSVGGPVGSAAGEVIGNAAGTAAAERLAVRSALKEMHKRIVSAEAR